MGFEAFSSIGKSIPGRDLHRRSEVRSPKVELEIQKSKGKEVMDEERYYEQTTDDEGGYEEDQNLLGAPPLNKSFGEKVSDFWNDNNWVRLIPCIILILAVWWVPPPEGLTPTSIHLFTVFLAIILGFLTQPYPMSVLVFAGLIFLTLTKSFMCETDEGESITCNLCGAPKENGTEGEIYECDGFKDSFAVALEGYAHETVWLVFAAFQLGFAVETTGLGKRISLLLVKHLGKSLVGLGYSICVSEMILALCIPSNTARGSVVSSIVTSICRTLGSFPEKFRVESGGEYLILVGAHANLISSSMYQIGMAANPIISEKALEILGIEWSFSMWLLGSCIPAIAAFLVLPWFMKLVSKSKVDVSNVRKQVTEELITMGKLRKEEKILIIVLISCLALWVTSTFTGLDSAMIALAGVVALVMTGTVSWKALLQNEEAWDTTIWLGGLILMADQLTAVGISSWIGEGVSGMLGGFSPVGATLFLSLIYFYSMYIFCSLTGHIVAFVPSFFEAGKVIGAPPYLLVALISYFSTLCGCMTNYSTGPIVIYFSQKYSTTKRWFFVGFLMSISHVVIWFSLGMGWWKVLDWY